MNKKQNLWIVLAGLNGFLAVMAGAFGSHALKSRLEPTMLAAFEVGVRYHMYHALGLLMLGVWMRTGAPRGTIFAAWCFQIGIILFSGSLYLLALLGWKWLGPVTPIGGAMLMLGWLVLAVSGLRRSPS